MLKALPLYLKLLWEIISKISLGWKVRLSAISSTSCAPLNYYLKQDLSQHLLSANGVTPCKHCYLHRHLDYQNMGFKFGLTEHTCAHTQNFSRS